MCHRSGVAKTQTLDRSQHIQWCVFQACGNLLSQMSPTRWLSLSSCILQQNHNGGAFMLLFFASRFFHWVSRLAVQSVPIAPLAPHAARIAPVGTNCPLESGSPTRQRVLYDSTKRKRIDHGPSLQLISIDRTRSTTQYEFTQERAQCGAWIFRR